MRVGARAHRQVVLAREAERLVVLRVEEQTRVVHLEDVDVREVSVECLRLRDRVHAVEGVRHVDEAALLANRRDGIGEREASRDLALEEEADYLTLVGGLHLFARDDDEVAVARGIHGLECAAEDVVVGDGDRADPLCHRVIDQLQRIDGAVEGP